MLLAKNFVQIPAAAQKIQHGTVPCCIFMEFPVPGRNRGLLLFPGIEPHAHQQTALDIGQVPLPEILSYLQERNLPYIEGCLLVGMRLYPRKKQ